jgi:hypothetical protein
MSEFVTGMRVSLRRRFLSVFRQYLDSFKRTMPPADMDPARDTRTGEINLVRIEHHSSEVASKTR